MLGKPLQRNSKNFCKHHQFVVGDETISGFDFANGFTFNGDTIDLHTSRKIRLGQSHCSSCLMDAVARNIFLSLKVVNLQDTTSSALTIALFRDYLVIKIYNI